MYNISLYINMNAFLCSFLFISDNVGQYENKIYFNLEQACILLFIAFTVCGCLETVLDWQEITLFVTYLHFYNFL